MNKCWSKCWNKSYRKNIKSPVEKVQTSLDVKLRAFFSKDGVGHVSKVQTNALNHYLGTHYTVWKLFSCCDFVHYYGPGITDKETDESWDISII